MKGAQMSARCKAVSGLGRMMVLCAVTLLAAAGCSTLSSEKLDAYRAATSQARTVGEEILLGYPRLRDEVQGAIAPTSPPRPAGDPRFDWADSEDQADDSVAVRLRAWEILVRYNDLLAGLVSGRPAADLGAEIDGLAGAASQIQSLAGAVAGASPYLSVAKGLLLEAKKQADRAAAVESFIEAGPEVLTFVDLLKRDTKDFYALRKGLRDLEYGAMTDRLTNVRLELRSLLEGAGVVTTAEGAWTGGPPNLQGIVDGVKTTLDGVVEFRDRGVGRLNGSGNATPAPSADAAAGAALAETIRRTVDEMTALNDRTLAAKSVLEAYDDLLDAMRESIEDLRADALSAQVMPLDAEELERCILAVRIAVNKYQETR